MSSGGNTIRALSWSATFAVTLGLGCAKSTPAAVPSYPALPSSGSVADKPHANDDSARLGGRLFDDFAKELRLDFVADDPATPAIDGKGGPFKNGSLPDQHDKPMRNEGHDYRLVNLLGTDLHGAAGISGKANPKPPTVLLPDLLKDTDSRETWSQRLTRGEDAIPAYGSVLSPAQIGALAEFLLGVRDGLLPQPDELFTFDEGTPGFYRLQPGGDAARGHALFEKSCKGCHGKDGTKMPLAGGKHSLGTYLRTQASSAWLKILVGNAGTRMGPQLDKALPRQALAQQLRDLLAAGCDRGRYPRGAAGDADVPDGDARCGAYLK